MAMCMGPSFSQLCEPHSNLCALNSIYSLVIVIPSSELQIDPSQLCFLVINPYDLGQLLDSLSLNSLTCKPGVMGPISWEAYLDQMKAYR